MNMRKGTVHPTIEAVQDTRVLVTGAAGFIGMHLCLRLLREGYTVVGIDNLNHYYEVSLKLDRLRQLGVETESLSEAGSLDGAGERGMGKGMQRFTFYRIDISDREALEALFAQGKFTAVVNLAAQAGVRYSLQNPAAYVESNVSGFLNILECCRAHGVRHLVYASSSSVYGLNSKTPYSEADGIAHPASLYAATKKGGELMAHVYSHLYGLATTGLRFFTVYGPWGRPDMSPHLFVGAVLRGETIRVFNGGDMLRDFTYVDDIVEGVARVIPCLPEPQPGWDAHLADAATSSAPYRVYNIGNGAPVRLLDFIEAIEGRLGRKALREYLPMQPGDVYQTWADCSRLQHDFGYSPTTALREGIAHFVDWYRDYYGV